MKRESAETRIKRGVVTVIWDMTHYDAVTQKIVRNIRDNIASNGGNDVNAEIVAWDVRSIICSLRDEAAARREYRIGGHVARGTPGAGKEM